MESFQSCSNGNIKKYIATKKMENKNSEFLIELNDVSKIYGNGHVAVKALQKVNLKLKKRDFFGIIGPSGSGKTTLLNMVGALDKPSTGDVIIDGVNTSKMKESKLFEVRRGKIGFIFQTYYLIPTLSALQNVLLPTFPMKNSKKNYEKKAMKLLKTVGLKGKEHRKPFQLSGGEQQRVAIARSLILDPVLILADEPTGNLDTKTGMGIVRLMRELDKKEGKTFIVVTHDQRLTKFCDRVVKLEDGKIVK